MIQLKLLQCPSCRQALELTSNPHLLSCGNHIYPYFHRIAYLHHPNPTAITDGVQLIQTGRPYLAQIRLLGNSKKQGFFALILISAPIFTLFKKPLFQLLSSVISHLSPSSKSWFSYLKNRSQLKTHRLAVQIKHALVPSDNLVDLGCGTGHFLASNPTFPNQIGLDNNPLNLLLARRFFVSADTLLLCTDLNQSIPLKSATIKTLTMHDAFYDIKNKIILLSEAKRVLKDSGIFAITGIDTPHPNHLSPFPISPNGLEKIIPFPHRRFVNDDVFYQHLQTHRPLKLIHTQAKNINKALNYSVLLKKQPFTQKELGLIS